MMQQTDKYKLNLMETSDPFSPSPLNENMEKVEGALLTKTDAAALEARLAPLEAHKIVMGTYGGGKNYSETAVQLGFMPKLVILQEKGAVDTVGFLCAASSAHGRLTDDGFVVGVNSLNKEYRSYLYIAFI